MFKKTALVTGLTLAMSATAFADYRFQVDGQAGGTNFDNGDDDADVYIGTVAGTFFFDEVDTGKGPLSEAAFLDHASYVSGGYKYTDADDIADDAEGDEYGISGRYVLGLDAIPLIFEGSWTRQTPDFSDIDYYSLGFGAYVTEATTVVLTYSTSDVEDSDLVEAGDIDKYDLTVEHLWALPSGAIKLRGNYGVIDVDDGDDIDAWEVAGTYYVNDNLGFGTGYGRFDNFGIEEDTFSAHVEWFASEQVALSLAVEHSEIDDTDLESDSIVIGAKLRF